MIRKKDKGLNAERELVHLLWENGFAALRIAGSGSTKYPSPDVIAIKAKRILLIECKATINDIKYLTQKEIEELKEVATIMGGEPWVGIRVNRKDWFFVPAEELQETKKHFVVNETIQKLKGFTIKEIIEEI